jgi:hypothetical protein
MMLHPEDTEGLHPFDEGGEIHGRSKLQSKPSVLCDKKCQNPIKPVFLEGMVEMFSICPGYRFSLKNLWILFLFSDMATQRFTSFYFIIIEIFNIFSNLFKKILRRFLLLKICIQNNPNLMNK